MELKRAKEVLTEAGVTEFSKYFLFKDNVLFCINSNMEGYVKGKCNPDQLIAIATWMRDPEGVVWA